MKTGWMRWLGLASWLITALASINLGLAAVFRWDLFRQQWFMTNFAWALMPSYYIIGIAGVISLVLFCMMVFGGCCGCGCKSCDK